MPEPQERTSRAKHTPGPWRLDDYAGDHALLDADDARICVIPSSRYVDEREDPAQEANARLIASAPELLAALRDLFNNYKQLADSGDAGFWRIEDTPEGQKAMAAIAKATGA